jgi:hypothetical protein
MSDLHMLEGLEHPLLESLLPELVPLRATVRAVRERARSGCASCDKQRALVALYAAVGKLNTYIVKAELFDVYQYLLDTINDSQPSLHHA